MTQNEHVYGICCRSEEDDDVISGQNVKTIEGYVVAAVMDIDDSIKQNLMRVSLNKSKQTLWPTNL